MALIWSLPAGQYCSTSIAPPVLSEETTNTLDIEWKMPPWDGGSEVTSYRLRRDVNKDEAWGDERPVRAGDGESEIDVPLKLTLTQERDGLVQGRRYRYQVAAVTEAGQSPWSDASNDIKIPTKLEFIVIAHDRKKAKKARETKEAAEAKAAGK